MRGVIISVVFHTMVVLAVAMGLPWFHKPPQQTAQPVTVDIVRLADITQASKGEKPKPKPEKKPDAEQDTTKKPVAKDQAAKPKPADAEKPKTAAKPPETAKPETQKQAEQKPPPQKPAPQKPTPSRQAEAKPKASDQKRVEIDPRALKRREQPKPDAKKPDPEKPKEQAKKKPAPDTQQAKKPEQADPPKIAATPRLRPRFAKKPEIKRPPKTQVAEKPKPKNALDSVFKSVRKMKQAARRESDRDRTAAQKPKGEKSATRSLPMSLSEIDAVRQQIKPCWNFPTGARNADSLRVLIKVWLNRDGTVRRAQVMDRARMSSDPYFRAAAEAGRRAVENPRCNPLKLPADKYDRWKVLIIDFDPSKLRTG